MNRSLIFLAMGAITAMWMLRVGITGSFRFDFIVWNIVLAFVPLLVEPLFGIIVRKTKGALAKMGKLVVSAVWLLFLPNAFYILTDLMHLNSRVSVNARDDSRTYTLLYDRGDGLYVFDSLLLVAATVFGAYVGGLALLHAWKYFRKRMPQLSAGAILALIMTLSAVGVYIGRFGRWNSWDGLIHPHYVISDLFTSLITPATQGRFLLILLTMLIFQLSSVLIVQRIHKR
ncbi:MAG TPA: DUF1361 domain-containing protein [Candidatus Saccharimonadia bacterium]